MAEELIGVVVGAIIGAAAALMGSIGLEYWKDEVKLKKIAKALYNEIEASSRLIKGNAETAKGFLDTPEELFWECLERGILLESIFSSYSLYSEFKPDISGFNKELSDKLYLYYTKLIEAEHLRQKIEPEVRKNDTISQYCVNDTSAFMDLIIEAADQIDDLKEMLEKYSR